MDRDRRDRHELSPSREARASLLSRIAEKRAGKNVAIITQLAHAEPLPESDSDSDTEFASPEANLSAETAPSQCQSSFRQSVKQSGDGSGSVLDTLGRLSLGSSLSESSSTSTFLQEKNNLKTHQHEQSTDNGAYRKIQGSYANEPLELSSDDEDAFRPKIATKQGAKIEVNSAETASQRTSAPQKFDADKDSDGESIKTGEEADMVLGQGNKKYILSQKIASKLYKHQQSGIRWLWDLHLKQMGGILGDDMGLGKTMQIAAFFAGLFASKLIRTAMVVAPKTLISLWVKELANVGLSRKTYSFVDTSSRVREQTLHKVLQLGGVLLTTYDMVRCNWKALRGDNHGRDGYGDTSEDIMTWDYLVLDEGHLIKNPVTERAKSLRELPSAHRIIISGTPIQNNLKEMWALMDFCCPGLLGDKKEFKDKYESQIVAGNDKNASDRSKRLGAAVAQELRQKLAPFFLRRMKSEVFPKKAESAESPKLSKKNDLIVWLKLTTRQEQLYRAFLESEAVFNALDTSKALTALSVLKKICDHPSLLTKRAADDIAEGMEGMMGNEDRVEAEAMTASLAGLLGEESSVQGSNNGAVSCKIVFVLILLVGVLLAFSVSLCVPFLDL